MISLKIDTTSKDLAIESNKFVWLDGIESIRQHLQVRLRAAQGEWFLDTSIGVPYFQDILKKNPDFVTVTEAFRTTILDTPGVIQLLEFDYDYDNTIRKYSLTFRALTDEGILDFSSDA